MTLDFSYWNGVDPDHFLVDDWDNPSRAWAGSVIREKMKGGFGWRLVEVGPGPGVDYARQFRSMVFERRAIYMGYEGSSKLCGALRQKYPEASWRNAPLSDLRPGVFDFAYAKAVLEHQPALEPALTALLNAARTMVIIVWYRPPAEEPVSSITDGVYYQTFRRSDVLAVVAKNGWKIAEEVAFDSGNLGWKLVPIAAP